MMIEKCCAFTGHRPRKLPWGYNEADARCVALKETLATEITKLVDGGGNGCLGSSGGSCLEKRKSRAETPPYPAL